MLSNLKRQKRASERKNEDIPDFDKQIAETEKLIEKHTRDMGDMTVSTKAIFSHFVLPAGLPLHGRIVVLNTKERDLEMIEFGLNALSRNPVLGAQSARGCGEITGTFDVIVDDELKKKISIGGYEDAKTDDF